MKHVYTMRIKGYIEENILAVIYATRLLRKNLKTNSGLNEIQTNDVCDAGTVLYQLNYQANWEKKPENIYFLFFQFFSQESFLLYNFKRFFF